MRDSWIVAWIPLLERDFSLCTHRKTKGTADSGSGRRNGLVGRMNKNESAASFDLRKVSALGSPTTDLQYKKLYTMLRTQRMNEECFRPDAHAFNWFNSPTQSLLSARDEG
jgi:hypothetical protein